MRYRIEQITEGEEEVIVHYRKLTPEVRQILDFFGQGQTRLMGWKDETKVIVKPEQILYVESVDGKTFAYTKRAVVRLEYQLSQLEQLLWERHFFRCSKSMIVNIDKVESLKSLPSNRIDAVMCSGEHIIISRTYASEFRKRLKGGRDNGET
ncbi:MAG: LytTR family transcriptional regulator DNA-binding domain-containing protein [Lachnospiraceae bacterium]|nr:LytTR family transcriptional regulator DNA-binding domain-containing protein [Lachnospiraceae bacterium]